MKLAKSLLRRELLEKRRALAEKRSIDLKIFENLISLPEYKTADLILLYCSYGDEVDTQELAQRAAFDRKRIAFPRCLIGGGEKSMDFYECSPGELVAGYRGIPEPPIGAPRAHCDKNTLCIVPALAYDEKKNRLGYGGGFYDRYLEDFEGTTVGLCRADFLFKSLPREEFDLPVDIVITEKGLIK
ncbi:MAG: 5-formyltetrahydrofolate cyclo-ligase [Ruminococcaceae bacterium]|nr:5-formyltetrahydrofolate cyclo-ligase [Oscillospiraceae bacterium]